MVEYARKECGDCGGIFPANQMHAVKDKTLSGESKTPIHSIDSQGMGHTNTITTNHYSYERKLICSTCSAARTRRAIIGGIFTLLVVGAVVAYLYFHTPTQQQGNIQSNDATANLMAGVDDPNVLPTAVPANAQDGTAPASDNSGPISSDTAPASSDAQTTPPKTDDTASASTQEQAAPDDREEMDAAILKATPKALDSGQPERWKASGKSGYIVVSTPQAYADRTCRNVYATIIDGSSQTQSSSHQWCQPTAGGEWTAQ